jgi:hypothetical protein
LIGLLPFTPPNVELAFLCGLARLALGFHGGCGFAAAKFLAAKTMVAGTVSGA